MLVLQHACVTVSYCVLCMLLCVAVCCSVLQCVAVCCSVLQCVAVCCRLLQCVAVCCSLDIPKAPSATKVVRDEHLHMCDMTHS